MQYTMNSGDIWSEAPTSVIILKIIINTTQMITFSGALIGLATSMLQNLFNRRVHNVGKLKNHYVILNWSPINKSNIQILDYNIRKQEKIVINYGTIIILVHYHKQYVSKQLAKVLKR